jgi:arsenite methyltransferase
VRGSRLIVVNEGLGRKAIMITVRPSPWRRGSYGFDAPFAPAFLTAMAVLYMVLAIISGRRLYWLAAAFILAVDALYIYTTRRGKFAAWAQLLGQLNLRGNERILDLGCGRGAVLLLANT